MKKAFSLIEMAIALIVIGIIIAMILEGSSLVESAKIKAEINKINKLQGAFASFYLKHDRVPGSVATNGAPAYTPKAIYEELMSTELVVDTDFNNTYIKGFWSFQGCEEKWLTGGSAGGSSLRPGIGNYWNQIPLSASDNICLVGIYQNPRVDTRQGYSIDGYSNAISPRFGCYMEILIDDGIYYTGKGMKTSAASDTHGPLNPKCDVYSDVSTNMGGAYMFRIY